MVIAGYRNTSFTAKDTGELIAGYTVYTVEEFYKDKGVGCYTDSFFLSDNKFDKFHIKDLYMNKDAIKILYNKYGKIESISKN